MKFRPALWKVLILTALSVPLHAQFLDTFTVSDPSNYTIFKFFPVATGTPGTFAVNGSGQFQPSSAQGTTTAYFRNTGETLSDSVFGNTLSIEIDKISSTGAAGLGFATSLAGANYFEFSLLANTNSVTNGPIGLTFNFALGPVFETVTRIGDTTFAYSFTGLGLTSGPLSGTFTDASFAGQNVYFGMDIYSGSNTAASQPIEDNLSFALTAPEPSAWAMILGGVALLVGAARFRVVRS